MVTELEQVIASSTRLSDRSKTIYRKAVQSFIAHSGEHPGGWTGFEVERWRDELSQTRKPQSVNNMLAGLRYASRRLAELSQNPQRDFARYAETLKVTDVDEREALTHEDGAAMVGACVSYLGDTQVFRPIDLRDRAICILGLKTGLRRAAICGIAFDDLAGGRLTVTLKGGKRHTIILDGETLEALNTWMSWLSSKDIESGYLFRSLSKPLIDGSVKINDKLSPDGLYRAMKKRAESAGVKKFHPHIFRHTFVSWCRLEGIPAYRIAQMTGHKSDGMLDTYTTDLDAEANPVGGMLPSLSRWRPS